jgi:hypothetical protein
MSYEDAWAAINLQMPPRVPRMEFSTGMHWELLKTVTGINVTADSPGDIKARAELAFDKAWDQSFFWSVLIGGGEFGDYHTDMGHANFMAGGVDFRKPGKDRFTDPEEVLRFDPVAVFGKKNHAELVRRFEEHYASNVRNRPFGVNMTGVYVTMLSAFIDMLGWDMLLLAAGTDAKRFGDLANRYAQWLQQYFDAMADSNVPVFMVHDDMVWSAGAFLHPDWYRAYVFPNFKKYFAPLRDAGKKIMFTSDGNYTEFVDDVVATGVHGLVMEPLTDMAYVAQKYGRTHAFFGNADTRILLKNDKPAIRAEVERCMAIGKGCPGYFMNVGNHIPPNTPVDACLYYNQVYMEMRER